VTKLVEFLTERGATVIVEVPDVASDGEVTRGLHPGKAAALAGEHARRTFEEAVATIQPAAESLVAGLRTFVDRPDDVQVEFGVGMHAEAGAFIASAGTDANFKITLTWRRQHGAGGHRTLTPQVGDVWPPLIS